MRAALEARLSPHVFPVSTRTLICGTLLALSVPELAFSALLLGLPLPLFPFVIPLLPFSAPHLYSAALRIPRPVSEQLASHARRLSTLDYPGLPWSTAEYPVLPWSTLEYC